jgi:hypothetical protein
LSLALFIGTKCRVSIIRQENGGQVLISCAFSLSKFNLFFLKKNCADSRGPPDERSPFIGAGVCPVRTVFGADIYLLRFSCLCVWRAGRKRSLCADDSGSQLRLMKWPRLIRNRPAGRHICLFAVEIPVIFLDIKVSGGDNVRGGIRSPRFAFFCLFFSPSRSA